MIDPVQLAILIVLVAAVIIFFYSLPRYGPHYSSRLTCPKCNKQFNYHWIPGASWLSLRRGNKRNLRCPYCHQVSSYNIAENIVKKKKTPP